MNGNIRDYARLGLVHHMLYPRCTDDAADHAATLREFVQRPDIETFDCCLPYGSNVRREELAAAVRNSGKADVTFATHLFPLRKLGFAAVSDSEQGIVRLVVRDMVAQAVAIGATGFIFASGQPAPDQATPAHLRAFADFCRWLCGELASHGIGALLEPFDTDVDKRFLYGSTAACVALIRSLQPDVTNLGIELDVAHVPLMHETFVQAIDTVAPHLKRVHLGNCVLKDRSHPRYGDTHPPVGFDGGEIDVPELAQILRRLCEVGFLNRERRGSLVIEMTPWPGRTVDDTIADSFARLERAWALA
jgi:sugar phosphate isomerase/epimerase